MEAAQKRRPGRPRKAQTATQAVVQAQANGDDVQTTKDAAGTEFLQRPISLSEAPAAKPQPQSNDLIKVYHKQNRKMWLADGQTIGPHEEKWISRKAADHPNVAKHIVKLA